MHRTALTTLATFLLLLTCSALRAGPMVLYTFEGDSGTNITDKLTFDGAQDATNVTGAVSVDTSPANAAFGSSSGSFPLTPVQQNTLDIPAAQDLGTAFTLAAMVDEETNNFSRVFSVYNGGGPTSDELIFDIDPSNTVGGGAFGVRAFVHGTGVTRSVNFADANYHHLAMTYNNGTVRLYLDGNQLGADATVPGGAVSLFNNLRFGEDYPPTSTTNERLEGHADDILVCNTALTAPQIKKIATNGAAALFSAPSGILYTAEGDSGSEVSDQLTGDGAQNGTFSNSQVTIDSSPTGARFGTSSIAFGTNTSQRNTVTIADSTALGEQFTLSVFARYDANTGTLNQARLFTSYDGSGAAVPGELLLDYNPAGGAAAINGMRFLVNTGSGVQSVIPSVPVTFNDGQYHHLAATYDNGQVRTYLDGVVIATGTAGSGFVNLIRNLQLGEDAAGGSGVGEQFIGRMDDVLVLPSRALSDGEVRTLATFGADAFLAGATANPSKIGIYYDAEGPLAVMRTGDKLVLDGAQNAVIHNNVTVNTDPANARFGDGSFEFAAASGSNWNTIELPGSTQLGDAFTLAAFVDPAASGVARLLGNYDGSGPILAGELLTDFDPSGTDVYRKGFRAIIHQTSITPPPDKPISFDDGQFHHLAITYDDGQVMLYLDGSEVASGIAGSGPVNLTSNLLFGEDWGGTVNEQFRGFADEILLVRRALSPQEIALLAQVPYASLVPEPSTLVLLGLGGLGLLLVRRKRK
jgi:hypothetical protein